MAPKNRRSVVISKIICGQCRMEVKEDEEENIQCDKCAKIFHSVCTKLDKRQYKYLIENESEEYVCHLCDDSGGVSMKAELIEIKTNLKKLDQLTSITEAIEFMSKQYDQLLKGIAENNKKLEVVQKENRVLKNEIVALKTSVKILNDQRVQNDIIIRGVEAKQDSTAVETVLELSKKAGVDLNADNIDDAYFFKNKGENKTAKKTMFVKFNNKKSKDKLMMSKSKLREIEDTKTVFLNDYLSKETLSLFNYAKCLKSIAYSSVYTSGGRVFVRKSEISKPRLIRCEDDVDQIMAEAATSKTKRRSNRATVMVDDSDGEDGSNFVSPV